MDMGQWKILFTDIYNLRPFQGQYLSPEERLSQNG
jgi:hypothetical protein